MKHSALMKARLTIATGLDDFKKSCTTTAAKDTTVIKYDNINSSIAASKDVLDAEILWCLKALTSHFSYKSCNDLGKLFSRMFHDSMIAKKFSVSEKKIAYLAHFGIAPHFQNLMHQEFKKFTHFTILFDETLNKTNQKKQLDLHIRYWGQDNKVVTRYLTSIFLGHATATDIFAAFQVASAKLDLKKLVQISMDGPAVNWCFYENLQKELKKEYDVECINIGSCGLHILNNAFRKGASSTGWEISSILTALYYLFKNSPARREDFLEYSELKKMPLKFVNHRWLENAPVSLRAFEIWNDVKMYVNLIKAGKLSKISSNSFQRLEEVTQDNLIKVKLLFFSCVSEIIKPFLETYQSDEPLIPFFASDIQKLIIQCLQHFKVLKSDYVAKISASLKYLCDFDFTDRKHCSSISNVNLGFRADKLLHTLYTKKEISDKEHLNLKQESQNFITTMLHSLMEKCPINYSVVRNSMCLDPNYMINSTNAAALNKMKNLLIYLTQKQQVSEEECDDILLQYSNFLENIVKPASHDFKNFDVTKTRLDTFLYIYFEDGKFPKLWKIFKIILTLSHGQASVERGFSINKNIEVENLKENSYIAQRIICDYLKHFDNVHDFCITKEMRVAAAAAHSKYNLFLEEQRKTVESENAKRKRELDHSTLAVRKSNLEKEIAEIENRVNKLSERANKTKDFSILTECNNLQKLIIDKTKLLRDIESQSSTKRLKK